jgi:hypothetical protein
MPARAKPTSKVTAGNTHILHAVTVCMYELISLLGDCVHYLPHPVTVCMYELISLLGDCVHYLPHPHSGIIAECFNSSQDRAFVLFQSLPSPYRTAVS